MANTINYETIDKLLVSRGKLSFMKEGLYKLLQLNDEGLIDKIVDNKIYGSIPFSKTNIVKECKELVNEGYELDDSNIPSQEELDAEKQNIEQGIQKVDELQNLKDELLDKVNSLVNESYTEFPSTTYTSEPYNLDDAQYLDFNNNLNKDQSTFIFANVGTVEELYQGFCELLSIMTDICPQFAISIDEYIKELLSGPTEEDSFVETVISEKEEL